MTTSVDNNKNPTLSIFQGLATTMSDEEESWDGGSGAFPVGSKSGRNQHHVFADEPFAGEYYSSLEIVQEGSKESTVTPGSGSRSGSQKSQDEFMTVSVASSETPGVTNTAEAVQQKQQPLGIQHSPQQMTSSSGGGGGGGFYPYNIYQSLREGAGVKDKKEKDRDSNLNDSKVTESTVSVKSTPSSTRRHEREQPSILQSHAPHNPHNPHNASMSLEEESSVMTDQQSQAASQSQPNYSVISSRSRRQGKRYTVRHTLATSQQVTANPTSMLKNLFIGIEEERHMNKLTAQNLRAVNNWLLFLPSIILTLVSGLVVLIFEADLRTGNEQLRVYSSIFVGVTSLISVIWQAIMKQLDLGVRAAMHESTASALKRLSEDILLTLSSTDNVPAEYVALVGEKFGQALDSCQSNVPYKLENAFAAVSDRMVLILRPPFGKPARKHVQRVDFMQLYATVYDELTMEIISHWAWPFAFPQSRDVSDAALRNFKMVITEGREVKKSRGCLSLICPCLSAAKPERSLFDVLPAASNTDTSVESAPHTKNPYLIRSHMLGQEV